MLYALDAQGRDLGEFRVSGARDRDWEDLDSFTVDGKPYLLIADTGDNVARYDRSRLYVVEEPERGATGAAGVAWTIEFAYADGPRDCEAVAVDATGGRVLLLTKRDTPPRIYAVPLSATAQGEVARAELLATLDRHPNPPAHGRRMRWAALPDLPTAWDITSDWIAILTYGRVYAYRRIAGEPLLEALAREPAVLGVLGGFRAEALALAGDDSMYVTGEAEHAPIIASTCPCDACSVP